MNIKLVYQYKNDSGTERTSGDVILQGNLTDLKINEIWDSIPEDMNLFIPSRLGLPHLSPVRNNDFDSFVSALDQAADESERAKIDQSDHPWHEILCIERTDDSSNSGIMADDFYLGMIRARFVESYQD